MRNIWEQYTPKTSEEEEAPKKEEEKKEPEKKEEEEEDEDKEELYPFKLHQGKILETYNYPTFISAGYESDYEGLSNEADLEIDYTQARLKELYKGVRCSLLE